MAGMAQEVEWMLRQINSETMVYFWEPEIIFSMLGQDFKCKYMFWSLGKQQMN